MAKKINSKTKTLNDIIIDAADEKKAENIVIIDLSSFESRVCDYFIVCSASTAIQVETIANHIEQKVKELCGEKPYAVEGLNNAYWVILDYIHVVVHVMQQQARDYYELEKLWSDAIITKPNVV
ncbi:MAG: ribosome silencing factor [Bacteroidales bacterium]|nr:ribosome silencing factor [Bacteroidales bacterium]